MAKSTPRNEPCPCGSGKKYKNCCLHKSPISRQNLAKPLLLVTASIVTGVITWKYTDWETGLAIGLGILILVGALMTFINPPPAGGKGDPGAINFGG